MTSEPSLLRIVGTNDLVYGRMPGGEFLIRNSSGRVAIPGADMATLRGKLEELDAMPRLSQPEYTFIKVSPTVDIAFCADGDAIIAVAQVIGPSQTVELETWEIGRVARALA